MRNVFNFKSTPEGEHLLFYLSRLFGEGLYIRESTIRYFIFKCPMPRACEKSIESDKRIAERFSTNGLPLFRSSALHVPFSRQCNIKMSFISRFFFFFPLAGFRMHGVLGKKENVEQQYGQRCVACAFFLLLCRLIFLSNSHRGKVFFRRAKNASVLFLWPIASSSIMPRGLPVIRRRDSKLYTFSLSLTLYISLSVRLHKQLSRSRECSPHHSELLGIRTALSLFVSFSLVP